MASSSGTNFESIGSTSSSLLARVKVRDQDGWRRLVRLYGSLVLHWCRLAAVPQADLDDAFRVILHVVARHTGSSRQEKLEDRHRTADAEMSKIRSPSPLH